MVRRVRGGRVLRLALILVLFGQVIAILQSQSTATAQLSTPPLEVSPDRYIVLLREGTFQSADIAAASFDRRPGVRVDQVYDTVFRGFAGSFEPETVRDLFLDPQVAAVYPDYIVRAQGQSLEPGIDRVDADLNPTRAGNGNGSVDVDVAIIDSGVGPNSDLNIVGGYDCWGQGILRDYYGHGTHVAGIVGAKDNGSGVVGVAPGARIWSVRVLNASGNGGWSYIICGMEWVAEHADVIEVANMSLGGTTYENGSGCDSSPAHRAVCGMTQRGVTVAAAACNDGSDASICTPGKYPEVISVSAFAEWDGKPGGEGGCRNTPDGFYGCDDRRASFSNYGATVDIAAIGVGVYSTLFDNRFGYWSGTSMATPHVTGGAALLVAQYGRMSPAAVRDRLLRSGMQGPVPGDFDGYPEPILNVASLGRGTIVAPSSAHPGDRIAIEVGEIIPDTRAIFRLDGDYIGGVTATDDGTARRSLRVPELPYGKYEIRVTNHRKTLRDRILIRPLLELSDRSGRVGDVVFVSLKGYGAGQSILVTFDTGAGVRSVVRVRASSSGVATTSFVVPPSTRGYHRVTATDDSGHATYSSLETTPSVVAESPIDAGVYSDVTMRGFEAGEVVDLHWGSATGPVLRTKVVTASGSGFVRVLIPESATEGKHSLWAIGDLGTIVRVTVTTFAAAEEPTATPTTTLTATPTMSVVPSETPTETVTGTPAEPTASVTVDPSSATPTEVATESATSVSTETATELAATNTPVATETSIADADEPTVANSGMT
jgi:subtilisin